MILRKCTMCGKLLPLNKYNKKGTSLTTECKDCLNKRSRDRLKTNSDFIRRCRTPCVKCGEERWYIIDFHHRESTTKDFGIGTSTCRSIRVLEHEIGKCDCLCKNCHREFHFLQNTIGVSYDEYIDENYVVSEDIINGIEV